ncbi:EutP/PduV family microcompartment system protein [uncultured Vagococcus sp.]|uniref:EutP/PduV family microcompartment system protein n=1 Tax=uncultured Vagococcus sp. TaxID=189676 RepID=UPI0028D84D1F|nr:EutP/PduV family microcompartment system protein [uncultured Vagococcus sp.]
MKRHVMIIGARGSGKSTVANWLNETSRPLKPCQDAIYGQHTIDIPAGYLENPSMYRYILSLSQTAAVVLLLVDGRAEMTVFPPQFAKTFPCPVWGLITGDSSYRQVAEKRLREAGLKPPFEFFDPTDQALLNLKEKWLKRLEKEEAYEICDGN